MPSPRAPRCLVWLGVALSLWLVCEPGWGGSAGGTVRGPTVAVSKIAGRYGCVLDEWSAQRFALRGRFDLLEMSGDSRKASFNQVGFWLSGPPARRWGRWTMLESDADKMLAPLLNPLLAVKAQGYRVVVLDPGHGGDDKGANDLRHGIQEKAITLELAGAVRDILRQYAIDVRLTRRQDLNLELDERCQYALQARADVFVSIHLNSSDNPTASGIETHILPPAGYPTTASSTVAARDLAAYPGNDQDGANMVLGYTLQKCLLKYTRAEDRGVRRSRFQVIKNAPCPAALVECGFISNSRERGQLMDAEGRRRLVRALAEGLIAYLNAVQRARNINP